MKHVFCVHSNITYLSSIGIIDFLKLNEDDVLIIAVNFSSPGKIIVHNVNPYTENIFQRIIKRIKHFNYAIYIDNFIINKIGSENYFVYLPDMHLLGKLLVSNPKCVGFNFFEEGTASYVKYDNLYTLSYFFSQWPWRTQFFKINNLPFIFMNIIYILKGYNLKILSLPRPANCYISFKNVKFYGFSEDVFPNSNESNKIILSFKNIKKYFSTSTNINSLNDAYIWLGEDIVTEKMCSLEQYLNAINDSIIKDAKKNNISTIHIKFHHFENLKCKKATLELFRNSGFNVIIVPEAVCLEIEFLDLENVKVYGIASSLLFYASLIGHQSYAAYNLLNSSKSLNDDNFQFYKKRVTFLN